MCIQTWLRGRGKKKTYVRWQIPDQKNRTGRLLHYHCCCLRLRKWNVSKETHVKYQKRLMNYVKRDLWNVSKETNEIFQKSPMEYDKGLLHSLCCCQWFRKWNVSKETCKICQKRLIKYVKTDLWNVSKETYKTCQKRPMGYDKWLLHSLCCCVWFRKWNVLKETCKIHQKRPMKYVKRDFWNMSKEPYEMLQKRPMGYAKDSSILFVAACDLGNETSYKRPV